MQLVIRNLASNLMLLQSVLQEIVKDIQPEEEEEDVLEDNNYVTVPQFSSHYNDLVGNSALWKRLKNNSEYFKNHILTDENGHLIFCPIRMLELIERTTQNWRLKNKCQKYLIELDECD